LPVGAYRGQVKDDVTVTIGVGITDLVEAGIYSTFPGDGLPGSLASRGIDYSPQFSGYSGGHPGIGGVHGDPADDSMQSGSSTGGYSHSDSGSGAGKPILIDLKALAANDNPASIICVKVA
jgi:hypothetical protein